MSTNYHTAIAVGADADAATFNDPLGDLDAQIKLHNDEISAARGSLGSLDARLDVSLNNDGTVATGSLTAQSQFALADAANANGEVVRYEEFTAHKHALYAYDCIWSQSSVSAAADTDAAALTVFTRTDDNANWNYFVRTTIYKRANIDGLVLTGEKRNTSATLEGSIRLSCGAQTATEAVATGIASTPFALALDISALDDNDCHDITISMQYAAGAGGATGQIELRTPQIWATETAAAPI